MLWMFSYVLIDQHGDKFLMRFKCIFSRYISLQNVHYILGIGVTVLNCTVYNMNKPGYSFNTILSSSSFTSIFRAVESIFCIYSVYIKKEANLDIIFHCGVLSFSPF